MKVDRGRTGDPFDDLKIVWFVPVLMMLYAAFSDTPYPAIAWAVAVAAIAVMITIASVRYEPSSLVSVFSLMTLLSYSGAAFANLLLEEPAVREDLWEEAHLAMWGCTVGALGMAVGAWLGGSGRVNGPLLPEPTHATSWQLNVAIASILMFVVAAKVQLGVYYHSSVQDYGFESKGYLNVLNHLTVISYCGILLQLRRYIVTKSIVDGGLAAVLAVAPVIAFLPSGNRESAIGHLPLVLLAYMVWEQRVKLKVGVFISGFLFLIFVVALVGIYRDIAGAGVSDLRRQTEIIAEIAQSPAVDDARPGALVVGRLSDFVATGRIINTTPNVHPFRVFDGMSDWWQIAIPGFLRPDSDPLNFNEGAVLTYELGVSPGYWLSTPVMTVGDLYSRFGWVGVVFGMGLLGFILRKVEFTLIAGKEMYGVIVFALFVGLTWRIYTSSLLIIFVTLTRDLLLVYVLSRILGWIAARSANRVSRHQLGTYSRVSAT